MKKRQSINECQSIGIDVSKKELAITAKYGDEFHYQAIANKRTSILKWLKPLEGFEGIIIVESTAWYHYLVGLLCTEQGLDIRVLNPLLSSKHAKSAIRKVKSDPADSRHLAIMGVTEPDLPAPMKLTPNRLKYRRTLGLMHGLDKQIQSLKQRLKDFEECMAVLEVTSPGATKSLHVALKQLEQSKRQLQKDLDAQADSIADEEALETKAVFSSLPGLRPSSSMLSVTLDPNTKSAGSWIGFAGIDISVRQSGTWRGRARLTKRGNRYLRKRLFQAAWGACLTYPEVRAYYDHLKSQGRCHSESVLMIARKLLRIAYTLIQTGEAYDSSKAFAY